MKHLKFSTTRTRWALQCSTNQIRKAIDLILPGILRIKYFGKRDSVKTANVCKAAKVSKFEVVSGVLWVTFEFCPAAAYRCRTLLPFLIHLYILLIGLRKRWHFYLFNFFFFLLNNNDK